MKAQSKAIQLQTIYFLQLYIFFELENLKDGTIFKNVRISTKSFFNLGFNFIRRFWFLKCKPKESQSAPDILKILATVER